MLVQGCAAMLARVGQRAVWVSVLTCHYETAIAAGLQRFPLFASCALGGLGFQMCTVVSGLMWVPESGPQA